MAGPTNKSNGGAPAIQENVQRTMLAGKEKLYLAAVISGDHPEADRLREQMHDHLDGILDALAEVIFGALKSMRNGLEK